MLITLYGSYSQITFINYSFALASTIFTIIDFGRSNAILLSTKIHKYSDHNFSFFLVISILLTGIVLIDITGIKFFAVLLISALFVLQRTYYSIAVSANNDRSAVLSQITLALAKLLLVVLLFTFKLNAEYTIFLFYAIFLASIGIYYLKFYKHFFFFTTFYRLRELFNDMKYIGPNNISLVLTDRFEMLFFVYLISDKEYASFSSLIGVSYLLGVLVDAVMKKLYLKVRKQKQSNRKILFDLTKTNLKPIIISLICLLTVIPYLSEILLNFKLQNVKEVVIFSIIFQLLRFFSQLLELDFISHASNNILKIKVINLASLFFGFIICYGLEPNFTTILIIFVLIRLLSIIPLISFQYNKSIEVH